MGNVCSTPPTTQEVQDAAVRAFVSETAARAARAAISAAMDHVQPGSSAASAIHTWETLSSPVPDANQGMVHAAIQGALVGEVLPVEDAARVAADGTAAAIILLEPYFRPAKLPSYGFEFARYKSKLLALEASAAATATTCVYTVAAICAERGGQYSADPEFIESVVAATVRASCSSTLSKQPSITANKWVAILSPILAACLPTASAAYPHVANSSPGIVFGIYGGLFLVIITLMIGVAAVPFGRKCNPESISRRAAFLAFVLLAGLGTGVMCTMLPSWWLRSIPLVVGSLCAIALVILWSISGKHYR